MWVASGLGPFLLLNNVNLSVLPMNSIAACFREIWVFTHILVAQSQY